MPAAPVAPPQSAPPSAPAPTPSAARSPAAPPKPVSPQAVAARAAASKPPIDLNAATGSGTRQQVAPPKTAAPEAPKVRVPGAESDEFEAAFAKLQDTVGGRNKLPDEARPNQPHKPEPQPQDDADADLDDGAKSDADPTKEAEDAKAQEDQKLDAKVLPKPGNKKDPWKYVESYRKKVRELESQYAELKASQVEGAVPKEVAEKLSAIEKRNAELENEIGYVNYSKSKEFVETYQKPYENAWRDALASLNGLRISYQHPETGDTVAREITPTDIAALANLDPSAARAEIRQRFPDDYAEVKSHVDKIRSLANAQNEKLKEQQGKGGEWQKQQHEQAVASQRQVAEANLKEWKAANDEFTQKHDFLRPIEGEDERNSRLERAIAFVDEAMNSRANDPAMPAEARKKAIRAHAAIRNRAIAFSTLSHENKSLKGKVAELEKALADYQSSTPGNGEGAGKEAMALEPNGADGVFDAWMAGRGKR